MKARKENGHKIFKPSKWKKMFSQDNGLLQLLGNEAKKKHLFFQAEGVASKINLCDNEHKADIAYNESKGIVYSMYWMSDGCSQWPCSPEHHCGTKSYICMELMGVGRGDDLQQCVYSWRATLKANRRFPSHGCGVRCVSGRGQALIEGVAAQMSLICFLCIKGFALLPVLLSSDFDGWHCC